MGLPKRAAAKPDDFAKLIAKRDARMRRSKALEANESTPLLSPPLTFRDGRVVPSAAKKTDDEG